jgi:hypothetical protein
MKTKIKWISGALFSILIIVYLSKGGFGILSAIFLLVAVLICIPTTLNDFENKFNFKLKSVFKYIIVVSCLLLGILVVPNIQSESNEDNTKTNAQKYIEDIKTIEVAQKYIKDYKGSNAISELKDIDKKSPLYVKAQQLLQKADSINKMTEFEKKIAKEMEVKIKQKQQLEREIQTITEGVDFSTYRGTINALQLELVVFGAWTKIIKDAENSNCPEIQNLAKKLSSKVVNLQIKEFPKLRKEYTSIVAKKMWENDVEVYTSGAGNVYINITGGIFAANKNKQDFQNQIQEILTMFRFNQARYRWYKGADEYTYYELETPKDSELIKSVFEN